MLTRNWDYRYSWLRDPSLTLEALDIAVCSDEATNFLAFLTSSAGGAAGQSSLQIMYGIGGSTTLPSVSSIAFGAGVTRVRYGLGTALGRRPNSMSTASS